MAEKLDPKELVTFGKLLMSYTIPSRRHWSTYWRRRESLAKRNCLKNKKVEASNLSG